LQAEQLLGGVKADSAAYIVAQQGMDSAEYVEIFHRSLYSDFLFSCKSKMEQVKDEQRLKTTLVKVRPLNVPDQLAKENAALSKYIKAIMGGV
jgi:hypothetical protein